MLLIANKSCKVLFLKSFHLNAYHCDTVDLVVLLLLLETHLTYVDYTYNILVKGPKHFWGLLAPEIKVYCYLLFQKERTLLT